MSHRWSRPQKDRIHDSRVKSAELLACAFQTATDPPSVFVCTSASGLYGDRGDQVLTEGSEARNHFRSDSTFAWGRTTDDIASAGVQVCNVRFGLILGQSGGVLARLLPIFLLGFEGRLASGRQYISWISRRDTVITQSPLSRNTSEITLPIPRVPPITRLVLAAAVIKNFQFRQGNNELSSFIHIFLVSIDNTVLVLPAKYKGIFRFSLIQLF